MFCLDADRLRELDFGHQNIAASIIKPRKFRTIEVHVLTKNGAAINSFVVNDELVLGDVIINHHLARAYDNHLAHLLRVQPTDVNVCDDLARIFEIKENNVVDPFLHVSHALAANGDRLWVAKPILNDADIVGSEVPEGVDVGTNPPEVQALAVDVAQFTQLAGIYQSLHVADG